jgi:hypothetical protein
MRDSLPSSNDVTLFNQTFVGDQVRSIAGSYTAGCASNYTAGTATLLSLLYPYGIQFNSATSDLYISDRGSQCIFKIDSAGNRSNYIGNCQTSTFAATPTSDSISTSHKINLPGLIKRDRGINGTNNFFVIHNSRTTNSEVRYANVGTSDVTINYITIGPGEIKTIYSTLNYVNGISSFGEQICVSQGTDAPTGSASAHNVECYNRNTSVTSLRIGRPSAATVKGKIPLSTEQEGVNAASASLANPYDVEFDGEGNLWISEMNSHNIRKVKKWFSN